MARSYLPESALTQRTLRLVLGCASLFLACAPSPPADPPDVVLITLDSTRADYGYDASTTPNLDALGREGAVFESAYCDVTYTTPSMASTLTGTFASRHRLRFWSDTLPDSAVTITEILMQRGYATAAVIGSFALRSLHRLDQGFDVYDESFFGTDEDASREQGVTSLPFRTDASVTDRSLEILKQLAAGEPPFFLWIHYFGRHAVGWVEYSHLQNQKRHVKSYAKKLARTDRAVGRFLAALAASGRAESTLVIVHADHGEVLGEHNRYIGHGKHVYEPELRVPLIMRWPGVIPPGRRVKGLAANVDIAATILEIAGGPPDAAAGMDGRSLLPLVLDGESVRSSLYFETYLRAYRLGGKVVKDADGESVRVGVRQAGILEPPWKFVETRARPPTDQPNVPVPPELSALVDRDQLYHLKSDPDEVRPGVRGPRARQRMRNLQQLLAGYVVDAPRTEGPPRELTEAETNSLRLLGYVE